MKWSICIEKIFEKFDVEFDMSQRLNIIIGENGIGKSTVLRIIYATFKCDFICLSKYIFKKIMFQSENETFEIKYEDLFPVCSELEDTYRLRQYEIDDVFEESFENLFSSLYKLEKENRYIFAYYLSKCYHELPLGSRIERIIDMTCYVCSQPGFDPIIEVRKLLKYMSVKSNLGSSLHKKILELYSVQLKIFLSRVSAPSNVISANMVDMIPYTDDELAEPYYFSPALKWAYSQDFRDEELKVKYRKSQISNMKELIEYNNLNDNNYFGYFSERYNFISDEYNALLKKIYKNIKFDALFDLDLGEELVCDLENQFQIDINRIINRVYFSKEFIEEINETAAAFSLELIGENINEYVELDRSFFTPSVINIIESYLMPLILRDTLIGQFMNKVIENEKGWKHNSDYSKKLVEVFIDFYKENIDKIVSNCNSKITMFEELLNKFSTNKTYRIYPSGIRVYATNTHKSKKRNLELLSNDVHRVRLTELSSGEKKLMLILLEAFFLNNGLLLIDEPELSFTILWQEELLPAILDYTEIKNVIVATHSPFIASREDLYEYLIPLPMEV